MKSPAFQFYPSDWLSSRAVRLMDAEQRGWYIQLLAEAWESDPQATLPDDEPLLKVLAGVNSRSTDVEQRWKLVRSQFKKRGAVVYNERQMEEVVKQEVNRQKKSDAGKASAEARRVERELIKSQHLRESKRGNKRSTPVESVLPLCTNRTSTESNSSISSPIPSSTSEETQQRATRTSGVQGSRLPEDFSLTPEIQAWAKEHAPHVDLRKTLEEFHDYWKGVPGAKGRKLDWPATFRNRLRELEGRKNGGVSSPAETRPIWMASKK